MEPWNMGSGIRVLPFTLTLTLQLRDANISYTISQNFVLFCFGCQTCLTRGALSLVGFRRKFGDSCLWNPCLNDFPRTASRWKTIFPHRHYFRAFHRHGIVFSPTNSRDTESASLVITTRETLLVSHMCRYVFRIIFPAAEYLKRQWFNDN